MNERNYRKMFYGSDNAIPSWKKEEQRSPYGIWRPGSAVYKDRGALLHRTACGRKEILYRGQEFKFSLHRRGALIEEGQNVLLATMQSGRLMTRTLHKGVYDRVAFHQDGFVIQIGEKLILATGYGPQRMIYQGPFDHWEPHLQGIVVRRGKRLVLATGEKERVLCDGEFEHEVKLVDEPVSGQKRLERWAPHAQGVIFLDGYKLCLATSSIMRRVLYDFTATMSRVAHRHTDTAHVTEGQFAFSGGRNPDVSRTLRESGFSWIGHTDGCLVQDSDRIILLPNERGPIELYRGEWDGYNPHPYGVVVRKDDVFTLHDGESAPEEIPLSGDFPREFFRKDLIGEHVELSQIWEVMQASTMQVANVMGVRFIF